MKTASARFDDILGETEGFKKDLTRARHYADIAALGHRSNMQLVPLLRKKFGDEAHAYGPIMMSQKEVEDATVDAGAHMFAERLDLLVDLLRESSRFVQIDDFITNFPLSPVDKEMAEIYSEELQTYMESFPNCGSVAEERDDHIRRIQKIIDFIQPDEEDLQEINKRVLEAYSIEVTQDELGNTFHALRDDLAQCEMEMMRLYNGLIRNTMSAAEDDIAYVQVCTRFTKLRPAAHTRRDFMLGLNDAFDDAAGLIKRNEDRVAFMKVVMGLDLGPDEPPAGKVELVRKLLAWN